MIRTGIHVYLYSLYHLKHNPFRVRYYQLRPATVIGRVNNPTGNAARKFDDRVSMLVSTTPIHQSTTAPVNP